MAIDIGNQLKDHWEHRDDILIATVKLDDFTEAIALVQKIAALAEEHNHHPDISVHDYNHVTITLTSHDSGEVTERDLRLAKAIDKLL